MTPRPPLSLDDRLFLPPDTAAILWDLDGTLVDSFQFDLATCARILSDHAGRAVAIPDPVLREGFALSGSDFWRFLFASVGLADAPAHALEAAHDDWLAQRLAQAFPVNEGVRETLGAARAAGLRQAVVSNNPQAEVELILANSGLGDAFDMVAGNDGSGRAKKPAPDSYLYAASALGVEPARCAGVEDSVLGLRALRHAGMHAIAVASGAEAFATLKTSGLADTCYTRLSRCQVSRAPGESAEGPAAGPTCLSVAWNNDDWSLLGAKIGAVLRL
jgi:HAD superfamily hydrolase (TIGR01509 family)